MRDSQMSYVFGYKMLAMIVKFLEGMDSGDMEISVLVVFQSSWLCFYNQVLVFFIWKICKIITNYGRFVIIMATTLDLHSQDGH